MPFETSASRLWKRLPREERLKAAAAFFHEPPAELLPGALAAIVGARHLRPQVARALAPEAQAQALAGVIALSEPLASALIVALHLGERRPLLAAFLDALGLPHENGLLKEDPQAPIAADAARAAAAKLAASFPRAEIETYFNALWLQDPERWAALQDVALA